MLTLVLRLEKLKCVAVDDNETRRDNLGQLHHESINFAKTVAKLDDASHFTDAAVKSLVLRFNMTQVKAAIKIISDEVKTATEQNEAVNARLEFKQTAASRTPTGYKNRTIDLSAQKKKTQSPGYPTRVSKARYDGHNQYDDPEDLYDEENDEESLK